MTDAKLFEMAVQLVTAKIQNNTIPPSIMGQNDMIMDQVTELHEMLRRTWREVHHENNIHEFPSA